jgi:hypothetical protein
LRNRWKELGPLSYPQSRTATLFWTFKWEILFLNFKAYTWVSGRIRSVANTCGNSFWQYWGLNSGPPTW